MAAYTTPQSIADYLGLSISAAWTGQATTDAQVVSDWLDRYLGRSWQGSSPLTETHKLYGDRLWLTRPVTAITSITARGEGPADTASDALVVDSAYRILDAATGEVAVSGYDGYRVTVVYTSAGVVPTPVALAATIWAAHLLFPTLHPEAQGLARLRDDTLQVDYAPDPGDVPPQAKLLLGPYRNLAARVA